MLKPGSLLICVLAGLAGCSTRPLPKEIEQVPDERRLAPPPAFLPQLPRPRSLNDAGAWIPLSRWSRQNGCGLPRRITESRTPAFALDTSNGTLLLRINSRVANWDGLELHLGFEPQLINNQLFVHVLDATKNLEPLILSLDPEANPGRTVVIDPGHGGQNTGALSVLDGVCEKEYTLDWALRLEPLLAAQGWQVFLTRTNDMDVPLSNRVAIAEEHQADLFISLHFNSAAPSQDQTGLETYCLTPTGMPSTLTRGYDDDVSLTFANNAFDAENLEYAVQLHRALLGVIGADRGIRHARFLGVLRGQNRPAVLVEGGYLSNPDEARRIADPAYRQRLAEALAAALAGRPVARGP